MSIKLLDETDKKDLQDQIDDLKKSGGTTGADGKSAYEIAVANGFKGTETEWLDSLKGVDGKDGKDGKDGENGIDGVNGKDGTNGTNGTDGKSAYEVAVANGFRGTEAEWLESLKGKGGTNGVDGKDGTNGENGTDGKDGTNGADGVSPTVSVTPIAGGNRITITDAEGEKTVDVMNGTNGKDGANGSDGTNGIDGKDGADGYSPVADVVQTASGATITITDKNGTTTATIANGKDGADGKDGTNGTDGADGTNGKDGVSVTHAWNDTTLTVTSASGTSSVDLKGAKGDKGDTGIQGIKGDKGDKGDPYVLTSADKAEIAEQVEGATVVPPPLYVDSLDKMTDTSKVYVLASTGHIYAYMDTTVVKEITEQIEGTTDNPFYDDYRLGSDGSHSSLTGYVVTPYIDLSKYNGTIKLRLGGCQYIFPTQQANVRVAMYDENKAKVVSGDSCVTDGYSVANGVIPAVIEEDGVTATVTINLPVTYSGKSIRYLRYATAGTSEASNISVTHTATVNGGQWVDTGTTYAPTLTEVDKQEIAESVVSMIDTQLLAVIGDGAVTV